MIESRAAAAALLLCLCVPAWAGSSSAILVDERIELLGVVQHLAAGSADPAQDAAYAAAVERRFGALRGHAAVRLYRQAARRPEGEGLGILMLYLSAPPALTLARGDLRPPYLDAETDKELAHRFLWELRDFAVVSGFSEYFREQAGYYRSIERAAAAELGSLDPAAEIERYLRVSLEIRNRYVLSPLYRPSVLNSFILPYPDPVTLLDRPKGDVEVYTLLTWVPAKSERSGPLYAMFDVPSAVLWQEPLYVYIDPSFHHYEARYIPEPKEFYGDAAGCRQRAINCLKSAAVAGLVERLSLRAWGASFLPHDRNSERVRYAAAVAERLEEYEAGTATLWAFSPRLFGVFGELARPSAPPPALAPPALPIRSTSDFFDRGWRRDFGAAK
ncbi:MAG: hypothetical protein Q8T11_00845 [Elusimicrobiota bacterium]|nr:hypothetical protein [Elusimicrobiota bacterium]